MFEQCGIRIHVHMIHCVSNSDQLAGTCVRHVCLSQTCVCTYNEYDCFFFFGVYSKRTEKLIKLISQCFGFKRHGFKSREHLD